MEKIFGIDHICSHLIRIIDEKLMMWTLCNLQQSTAIPILRALNAIYCMLSLETIQHTLPGCDSKALMKVCGQVKLSVLFLL